MAINMPVQGTSADIIKVAMINLYREMDKTEAEEQDAAPGARRVVFEVPEAEMEEMKSLVSELMPEALQLRVLSKNRYQAGQKLGRDGID